MDLPSSGKESSTHFHLGRQLARSHFPAEFSAELLPELLITHGIASDQVSQSYPNQGRLMEAGKARWRSHNIYDNRAPSAIKAAFDAAKGSMEGGTGLVSDRVGEQQE